MTGIERGIHPDVQEVADIIRYQYQRLQNAPAELKAIRMEELLNGIYRATAVTTAVEIMEKLQRKPQSSN